MGPFSWSAASERNKHPILKALQLRLQVGQSILEIGSGTGQHVIHFARALPGVHWLPTDLAPQIPILQRQLDAAGLVNVDSPQRLDVAAPWPSLRVDGVYSANTAHIMSWREVGYLFRGVGGLLRGGRFYLYGPFNRCGHFTSPSNEAFDRSLRQGNPDMGIRNDEELVALAESYQLVLDEDLEMPSHNRLLVWQSTRTPEEPLSSDR